MLRNSQFFAVIDGKFAFQFSFFHLTTHCLMKDSLRDKGWFARLRRAVAVAAVAVLGLQTAEAQVDNYTFAASQGTFTPLSGSTVVSGMAADSYLSPSIPLGFNFVFDGTVFTSVKASSDGYLTFNSAATGTILTNNLATGAATSRPLVAPLWDDLDGRPTGATGVGSYLVSGTAPNRVFTFEWLNWEWRYLATGPVISFQAKLYEGSNRVEFVYRQESAPVATGTASIGLSGVGTGTGSFLSLSDATAAPTASSTTETTSISTKPADGQVYAFTPAPITGCPNVRNLTATALTSTTASVAFSASPAGTSYTVTYTPAGGTATTVTPAPTASPVSLAGLSPFTTYTVSVTANCGGGQTSTAQTATFTTFPYCTTSLGGGTCAATDNISNVTIAGTTLNNTSTACSVVNGNAYTLFPATGSSTATLGAGGTYQLSVTSTASSIISVWIDFDQNGTFEASEWQRVVTSSTANTASTVTLLVPANAVQGRTGMRIRSRGTGNTNGAGDACVNFASGETEDYIVTIGPVVACPVPSLTLTNLTDVSASLAFVGGSATSYTITYTPTGGTPTTVTPAPTASPVNLTGLTAATEYTVTITGNCGSGQTSGTNTITFTTQVANDECSRAQTLTAGTTCTPTNGSVFRASQSASIPVCSLTTPGTADDDVWYSFLATGTAHDIRLAEGTGFAGYMQLFSGSCGSLTALQCVGNATSAGVEILQATGLTAGTRYYVRVYSSSATAPTATNSSFTICVSAPAAAPANDNCATAQVLTPGATCTTTAGTTWLATQSAGTIPACSLATPGTADDDVWYSFVATSTGHQIDVDELTGFDGVVQVFSGSCGNLTALQCVDASGSGGAEMLRVYGLTVGQTYYVRIYSFSATAPTSSDSNFTICITTAPTPATNDECATATPVTVQFGTTCVSPIQGNNIGASASQNIPAPGCASYNGGDVWYSVVVPATGTLTLETGAGTGTPITDTGMAAYSGTCGNLTLIECDDDDSPTGLYSKLDLTGLTPGTTIYVRVWEFGNDTEGSFTLCAVTPSNCAAPTAPLATVTFNSATLSWSGSAAAGATYEVQYGAPNFTLGTGTTVNGLTTTTTTLNGLNSDTEYCYYVRQNCGTVNGQSAWVGPTCFRTNVQPASNDEPCNAITATINQFGNVTNLSGTLIGATTSTGGGLPNSLPACSPTLAPRDVWYRVTLPAGLTSMNAVFSGNAAGMVRLYTAANCSTSFTLVGCQASTGPNTSVGRVSFTGLTAGNSYYVAVSGFGAGDTPGTFTITAKRNALAGGEVEIFPNPVAGGSSLNVRASGIKPGTVRCEVLNTLGQVVLTRAAEVRNGSLEQVISTQGLAKGMYQVRLTAGSDVVVQKVVVE
jgi:GEVED domain/Fibronectin type III domain/Secretion system C-terminal sorting domain